VTIHPPIFGLVLAGGTSSRMGYDKGLVDFYGKPQREYVFEMLEGICQKVFLSCKRGNDIPAKLNPLPDSLEMESPLNGIMSAFQLKSDVAWLTVPVDMPLINKSVLEYLIAHRVNSCTATCFVDSDGQNPEPLVTLWEPVAYPELQKFHDGGQTSPRKFLQ
jgi:molybdopterin-guanine dinucleotide biosynthesis protein A